MKREDFLKPDDMGSWLQAWAIMAESARLMRQYSSFYFSFVPITAPYSAFIVVLVAAIDINRHYNMDDFFAQEQKEFLGMRFNPLTPEARHLLFLILNMVLLGWLNTVVCARGVISLYAMQNLEISINSRFLGIEGGVLRVIATDLWYYLAWSLFIVAQACVAPVEPPNSSNLWLIFTNAVNFTGFMILPLLVFCFVYPLPAQQLAAVHHESYGIKGYWRAAKVLRGRRSTSMHLAILTILYVVILKLLVNLALHKSLPFWTQFLAYPTLVLFVMPMSMFWQVAFTHLCFSCKVLAKLSSDDGPPPPPPFASI